MRRSLILSLAVLFVISAIPFSIDEARSLDLPSGSSTIYVGPGGNYSRLSHAVDNSSSGDLIMVAGGTYYDNIRIDKSLTIIGAGPMNTQIRGLTETPTLEITADGVTIRNMSVGGGGPDAVCVKVSANLTNITGCAIGRGKIGILLNGASNCLIGNNIISNCDEPTAEFDPDDGGGDDIDDDGPVAHWRFEESSWSGVSGEVRDSSGSNHGTLRGSGAPVSDGKIGKAASFSGSGFVDVGSNADVDITGNLSISAWIKTSSSATYLAILDKHHHVSDLPQGKNERGYSFYLTDGKIRLTIYSLEGGQRSAMGFTDLRDGKWHHVAGIWDQKTIRVYSDGKLGELNNWTRKLTSSPAIVAIGKRSEGWGGYMNFNGRIDELKLYDRPLSYDEVIDGIDGSNETPRETTREPVEDGLIGIWRMEDVDGAGPDVIADTSGMRLHGTAVSGAALDDKGRIGGSLLLDGYNDHVWIPDADPLDIQGDMAISSWVQTTSGSTYLSIMDKHGLEGQASNTTIDSGYSFYLDKGRARLTIYSMMNGQRSVWGKSDLRDGEWHHVVGVRSGSTLKIFVDGILEGTASWNFSAAPNQDPVGIGRRLGGWGGYMPFLGRIDEVHLFNRSISDSRVKELYLGTKLGAVVLRSSGSNMISGNDIQYNNEGGLVLLGAVSNIIDDNSFSNNLHGNILVDHISGENYFLGNDITNERKDLFPAVDNGAGNSWDMNKSGNYWSNWVSPDSNMDGIVDIAYNIDGLGGSIDNYPLTGVVYRSRPPTINTSNVRIATVGVTYSVAYTATDPDTPLDRLVWSMSTNAGWLTFSSGQVLSGTPTNSSRTSCWVNISVSDGTYSDWTNFTIDVRSMEMDFDRLEEAEFFFEEDSDTFEISSEELIGVKGSEARDITISGQGNFTLLIDEDGDILISPGENWFGTEVIYLTFYLEGTRVLVRMTLTVWPVNDPPTDLEILVMGTLKEGENIRLVGTAKDVDQAGAENLRYAWYIDELGYIGSGSEFDLELEEGTYNIVLRVTDPDGASAEIQKEVRVEGAGDAEMTWLLLIGVVAFSLLILMIGVFAIIVIRPRSSRRGEEGHPGPIDSDEWTPSPDVGINGGKLDGSFVHGGNVDIGTMERDLFLSGVAMNDGDSLRSRVLEEFEEGSISPAVFEMIMEGLDEM
ncbi:MAG: LamG-like jellyroll fold domain-containing protein [Thermoplasmatota archaeon]